jgi:hypothetical protein
MKTERTGATGRDNDAVSPQTYRLVCIHHPGKETGHRTRKRSRPASVLNEEQKAPHTPGPSVPEHRQLLMPAGTGTTGQKDPAGSGRGPDGCAGSANRNGDSR